MKNITKYLSNFDAVPFARGGFAVVHKANLSFDNSQNDLIVVVKFLYLNKTAVGEDDFNSEKRLQLSRRWNREIRVGQAVLHPNILPFLGCCDNLVSAYKEFVGIMLPFCKNGDANTYCRRYPDLDPLCILVGVGAAVFELHSAHPSVVHGDIKGANILIDDSGNPRLSDFGLSRICETEGFTTNNIMGTCRWMSAELLKAEEIPIRATKASDIWAFGMTNLELLTGRPPFHEMKWDGAVFLAIVTRRARPLRPEDSSINDALWLLFQRCWREDPASRPDARQVCLALDIVYGTMNRNIQPHLIADILDGAWDDAAQPLSYGHSGSASLPYKCKWLNCAQAFSCINDCISHECAELLQRRGF